MTAKFNLLYALGTAAVVDGVVPGLVVVVGQGGETRFAHAFGYRQVEGGLLPATRETVWDVASLTKALVTSLLCMHAVEHGRLSLDEPLAASFPAFAASDRAGITVRHALSHSTGLPAHRPFYEQVLGPGGQGAGGAAVRANLLARVAAEPLAYPPGARSLYSDLGFILLGDLLERRLGAGLDELAQRLLFTPLGAQRAGFLPVDPARAGAARWIAGQAVAAAERCPVRQRLLVGEVHDLNAFALGGVAGHAGLFAAADDLALIAHALCAAYRGAGSGAGRAPLVDRDVLRLFWQPAGVPGSTWRLGWDGPSARDSLAGDLLARAGVGHLAFTGCSLWIDPPRETFVLVLSNRVHPVVRDDPRFRQLRRSLNDAALAALDYSA